MAKGRECGPLLPIALQNDAPENTALWEAFLTLAVKRAIVEPSMKASSPTNHQPARRRIQRPNQAIRQDLGSQQTQFRKTPGRVSAAPHKNIEIPDLRAFIQKSSIRS